MPSSACIDLEQTRTQAKELLNLVRATDSKSLARIQNFHPEPQAFRNPEHLHLADCQLVIARELGYTSWAMLKQHVLYRSAVAALDGGNLPALEALLKKYPSLLQARCYRGEWYEKGYFKGAMLLHHVAGNPIRCPLPANILDIARTLLKHGAEPNAVTEGKATTIGLLLTSLQASQTGFALPLIELLHSAGAQVDYNNPDLLTQPLLNAAPETANELVKRGSVMDLRHAAGLGRLDIMEAMLAQKSTAHLRDEALIFASIRGQDDAAALLLKHGAHGDILLGPGGMTPRTALHEAANRGYAGIVKLLLEYGPDLSVVEPCWGGTPAEWAAHGGHLDMAELLKTYGIQTGNLVPY